MNFHRGWRHVIIIIGHMECFDSMFDTFYLRNEHEENDIWDDWLRLLPSSVLSIMLFWWCFCVLFVCFFNICVCFYHRSIFMWILIRIISGIISNILSIYLLVYAVISINLRATNFSIALGNVKMWLLITKHDISIKCLFWKIDFCSIIWNCGWNIQIDFQWFW